MSFRDTPITRAINPHTSRLEGDDSGYRNVPVCPLDEVAPDPMVELDTVASRPLYAIGLMCTLYNRHSVLRALLF